MLVALMEHEIDNHRINTLSNFTVKIVPFPSSLLPITWHKLISYSRSIPKPFNLLYSRQSLKTDSARL